MSEKVKALPVITGGMAPKGGMKAAASKALREAESARLIADGFTLTEKGRYVKPVAELAGHDGHADSTAYLVVDISISNAASLFEAPKAKAVAEDAVSLDIPDLD